jgi:hypothetical protein
VSFEKLWSVWREKGKNQMWEEKVASNIWQELLHLMLDEVSKKAENLQQPFYGKIDI